MGTVTITANTVGNFDAGLLVLPGLGGVVYFDEDDPFGFLVLPATVNSANYTVIPEPSTGLLVFLGLVGLAATRSQFQRPGRR